jgi:hypothetical protein
MCQPCSTRTDLAIGPVCHQHQHLAGWRAVAELKLAWDVRRADPDKWRAAREVFLQVIKERAAC